MCANEKIDSPLNIYKLYIEIKTKIAKHVSYVLPTIAS